MNARIIDEQMNIGTVYLDNLLHLVHRLVDQFSFTLIWLPNSFSFLYPGGFCLIVRLDGLINSHLHQTWSCI